MARWIIYFSLIYSVNCMGARGGDSGKCSYRFEVWTPDQNVLRRLEIIDNYQKNLTTHFGSELLKLRNDVLLEILTMKNVTHAVEKEILQQKNENMKLRLKQQEMQLAQQRKKENNLLTSAPDDDDPRDFFVSKSRSENKPHVVKLVTKVKNEVAKVQNSIGDLRAEWLLIKREIGKLRHSDNRLNHSYREMLKRMNTIETMVNGMQSDSLLIKRQQNDLLSENNGLGEKVVHVQKENDQLKQYQKRIRKSNSRIHEHLNRLRVENNYLHQSLSKMDSERGELRGMLGDRAENVSKYEFDVKANVPSAGPEADKELETMSLQTKPRDCDDLYRRGYRTSGMYRIQLEDRQELVYCDMYNNTGWLVVQRRVDGLQKFNRGWLEYKYGFGNPYGEFWQGNDFLFRISNSGKYTLRVEMWDWEGGPSKYADYDHFIIESEKKQYRLHVNKYHGNAGDSLSYHNDMSFSSEDMDNDVHVRNCASDYKGGWWYHSCYSSNLNGLYHTGWYSGGGNTYSDGVVWYTLKQSDFYSLRKVEMKLRPQN